MSLTTGRATLKASLLAFAENTNENKSTDQAADEFIDALIAFIASATVTVPGTGLVAPGGGGPVTGASITGTLS